MIKTYIADVDILNEDAVFNMQLSTLSQEMIGKVEKCKNRKDCNLTLGAWLALKYALEELLKKHCDESLHFKDIKILYGQKGKPYLEEYPDIFFNLSHSGHFAVCSIGRKEVGVDIEMEKESGVLIAKRFFTEKEYQWVLQEESDDKRKTRFARLWTLKEAFLKVTGLGLSLPLNSFEFSFESCDEKVSVEYQNSGKQYNFKEFAVENYRISVCSLECEIEDMVRVVDVRTV